MHSSPAPLPSLPERSFDFVRAQQQPMQHQTSWLSPLTRHVQGSFERPLTFFCPTASSPKLMLVGSSSKSRWTVVVCTWSVTKRWLMPIGVSTAGARGRELAEGEGRLRIKQGTDQRACLLQTSGSSSSCSSVAACKLCHTQTRWNQSSCILWETLLASGVALPTCSRPYPPLATARGALLEAYW